MDNIEKAMSGLGKSLKNNLRIGKRKPSLATSTGAGGEPSLSAPPEYSNDEAANSVISRIPHSPANSSSMASVKDSQMISQTNLRSQYIDQERTHLTNYFKDEYKQCAVKTLHNHTQQQTPSNSNTLDGLNLTVFNKVIGTNQDDVEADEQWKWKDVLVQLRSDQTLVKSSLDIKTKQDLDAGKKPEESGNKFVFSGLNTNTDGKRLI